MASRAGSVAGGKVFLGAGRTHLAPLCQARRVVMTVGTIEALSRGARHVLRVIELHIEALFEFIRERLSRRVVAVHRTVTDRTHGNVRRRELRQMTTSAILVSRKTGSR